jgi:hypothetical protein
VVRHILYLFAAIYQAVTGVATGEQPRVSSGYEPPSRPPGDDAQRESASGMAIATLVLGIGAWTYLPFVGAFIGAVLGWLELKKIERGESSKGGETITKIGFWLSVANIAFALVGGCVTVALIVFVFGSLGALLTEAGVQGLVVL